MESRARNKPRLGRRFLVRGESLIASTGLVLAAILLASMAATGYWTLRTQRDALDSARAQEIQSLGDVLCDTAGLLLSVEELTTVRRLIVDVGRSFNMMECRIVLPDGRVIASADPSGITEPGLPESWVAQPIIAGITTSTGARQNSTRSTCGGV